jgi:hypothetical protein
MPAFMVIAHRGASAYAPENTLAAFDLALRSGVRRGGEHGRADAAGGAGGGGWDDGELARVGGRGDFNAESAEDAEKNVERKT